MPTPPSFSLLTEPWILCRMTDGTTAELSIREIFDGEHPVEAIRGDSPTQDYAVLRVLLAIFWRAHAPETMPVPGETFDLEEWADELFEDAVDGGSDEAVLAYLEDYRARFDLLHPVTPFMQVAKLATPSGTASPVSRIIPEAESPYFTMRAGDGLATLSFAEAARWLVTTQAFDYSGIKSGAVGDSRVKGGKGYPIGTGWTGMTGGTTILGDTLRETLALNTCSASIKDPSHDLPAWEREPDGPAERRSGVPTGACDLLTWQSRRIRLFHDGGRVDAVLVSNGDRIPDAGANVLADPMTPYRFSKNKSRDQNVVYYPRPYETSRTMWRSLEPLIVRDGDRSLGKGEHPPRRPATLDELARVVGGPRAARVPTLRIRLTSASYGPQASSNATTVDARIELPRRLLHEDSAAARIIVLDAARSAHDAGVELGKYAGRLLLAAGGEYEFQVAVTDGVLADLEPFFRRWLDTLDVDRIEQAAVQWQQIVQREALARAQILLRGAGPRALIGREQIVDGKIRLTTAGTCYSLLLRGLRDVLPLLPPSRDCSPTDRKEADHAA